MANLLQTDYDQLAPQLANRKRTAGGNAGKLMREVEWTRGTYDNRGSPNVSGANLPAVRIIYTDGTQELLVYEPYVELFAPGSITLKASAGTP